MIRLPQLDPVFHQPVRARLAALLFIDAHSFSKMKSALGVTDGNLDAHLRKLSAAGYLHSRVVVEGRPHTIYQLSESGREAFDTYLRALDALVGQCRKAGARRWSDQ